MPKIELKTIPGQPANAKEVLYESIKQWITLSAPVNWKDANLEYFNNWWKTLSSVVIGENTIDVTVLPGESIEKATLAMYNLSIYTDKLITTSFNNVLIIIGNKGE